MKKLTSLFLTMLMLLSAFGVLAEGEEGAFPELNAEGFLDGDGEFLFEDPDEGVWRYASDTLRVEIYRYYDQKARQTWYEAEIWAAEGENFHMIANDPEKRMSSTDYPKNISQKHGVVVAVNSDYAHLRKQQKARMGIIIRDGEVLSEKTRANFATGFPNLDTLALLPDGDMKVFLSNELKAKDYLEMGAYDVLAFGPYLIRDGELNAKGLKKYGTSSAPRTAVGMVEPGRYFLMMLEGRHTQAKGAGVSWLAEKLLDKGCTVGFNLDGGQTSCMVFMGKQISKIGKNAKQKAKSLNARKTAEILGIGTSDLAMMAD